MEGGPACREMAVVPTLAQNGRLEQLLYPIPA
jgi:hypothetical protein